jgi:hypothetical protein
MRKRYRSRRRRLWKAWENEPLIWVLALLTAGSLALLAWALIPVR